MPREGSRAAPRSRLSRFRADESGSVTVEFVIVFPGLVLLFLWMVWTSLLIATLSDVQQLSSDLTRQSLRFSQVEPDADLLCARLRSEVEPLLTASMTFLEPARIVAVECAIRDDVGTNSVAVTYDLGAFADSSIARLTGWETTEVMRFATMVR